MTSEIMQVNQNELTQEDILIQVLQTQKELKQNQETLAIDVDYLKNEQPVNPSVCLALEKLRKKKVVALLGGKDSQAYRDRHFAQSVFSQAAKDFKDYFRIPRYDLLKRKDEEQAFDYWNSWEPSANTKLEIKARNGQMSLVG
ncbi:ORF6C domain-containing protein [Streptococcus gordonii]|uniref:ORF6C domain-containing protein n=1 Tax=Streptococcus gordonii TaxID=1302 RepID=UPI002284E311|nr:ORF6C domain-containing protein [Streptococcus gordonii]MCY7168799.1 ORF6C domain-containing protein [Streptococcus gordonii]